MNIESKLYRIRSTGFGQVEILHKPSGRAAYREPCEAPDANRLAMMKESDFDRALAALL